MAKRVWAVSRGEYSDYGVTCICPDEETAKAVAARLNGPTPPRYDAHEVEEFVLVESVTEVWKETVYRVEIDADGQELRRWTYENEAIGFGQDDSADGWREGDRGRVGGASVRGYDVALKIARDKLAELKASKAGL